VVDVSDTSSTELSEVSFFDNDNVLDDISPDGTRGSIFVLVACLNASPDDPSNLAATILSDGHGPASVAALSVVTVGNWFDESDGNDESIGYYITKRLVSNGYRLGESMWWTLADLVHKGNSGSGGVAYDLYGDPTLTFFGNPGGDQPGSLADGRRDPAGDIPEPARSHYPEETVGVQYGLHTVDTYGPTPGKRHGEVIVAAETYIDVLHRRAVPAPYLDGYAVSAPHRRHDYGWTKMSTCMPSP
jgi:hypothetical protein